VFAIQFRPVFRVRELRFSWYRDYGFQGLDATGFSRFGSGRCSDFNGFQDSDRVSRGLDFEAVESRLLLTTQRCIQQRGVSKKQQEMLMKMGVKPVWWYMQVLRQYIFSAMVRIFCPEINQLPCHCL